MHFLACEKALASSDRQGLARTIAEAPPEIRASTTGSLTAYRTTSENVVDLLGDGVFNVLKLLFYA